MSCEYAWFCCLLVFRFVLVEHGSIYEFCSTDKCSILSFVPPTSSPIMTWRLSINYECLALSYLPLALITCFYLFPFIYILPWGFLPFFPLSVLPVSDWWRDCLTGWPSLPLPHSPCHLSLPTFLCPPALPVPLRPSYWPCRFFLNHSAAISRQGKPATHLYII